MLMYKSDSFIDSGALSRKEAPTQRWQSYVSQRSESSLPINRSKNQMANFHKNGTSGDANINKRSDRDEIADYIEDIPVSVELGTREQISRFEMLRLALFAIKLRKLEALPTDNADTELARNLLRHAIFQQILTLTNLGERKQALQIVEAYRG